MNLPGIFHTNQHKFAHSIVFKIFFVPSWHGFVLNMLQKMSSSEGAGEAFLRKLTSL